MSLPQGLLRPLGVVSTSNDDPDLLYNGVGVLHTGELCVTNDDPVFFPNGIPTNAAGSVCITTTPTSPVSYSNGTQFDATGRLVVIETEGSPSFSVAGFQFNASGHLVMSAFPDPVDWLTVTGNPSENQTLTAALGGGAPTVTSYQWLRGYTPITGATASTYVLTADDVGRVLRVVANGDQYSAPSASIASTSYIAITTPNQSVASSGSAYTLTATSTAATLTWKADGSTIGTSTRSGESSHSIAWTPGAVDYSVAITAEDDSWSSSITMVSAEASRLSAIASWTRTGLAAPTTGVTDPDGGTAAATFQATGGATSCYISNTASSAPSTANSGIQFWVKAGTCRYLQIYPIDDGGIHSAIIDVVTGQAKTIRSSCAIVETRGEWKRIWMQFQGAAAGPQTFWLRMASSLTSTTLSGANTETMSFYAPRQLDGAMPMTDYQRASFAWESNQTGFERWSYNSPLVNSTTDLDGNRWTLDVIKPQGWTQSGTYRTLYVLPAVGLGAEDVATIAVAADIADSTNCVVVIPYTKDGSYLWYGKKSDGTADIHGFTAALPGFSRQHLGAKAGKDNHILLGYSKAGWGALSLILRNPTAFGYAYAWDTPWSLIDTWPTPDYQQGTAFGTQAQMALYDPKTLVPSLAGPGISGKKRVGIAGYFTFQSHQSAMQTALNGVGVPFDYLQSAGSDHSYSSGWLGAAAVRVAGYGATVSSPVIVGTAERGTTVSVDTGAIADADGVGTFVYEWRRNGSAISGATSSTYTLGFADVGATITIAVSYTDGASNATTLVSAGIGPVFHVNSPPTGSPTISGTAMDGQTLTAVTTSIADPDGLGSFSYQWRRDGVSVSGATSSTYLLTSADIGALMSVRVSWVDNGGTSEALTSSTVGPVSAISSGWTVVDGGGTNRSVTLSILDGSGSSFTVPAAVKNGAGTDFTPI